MNENAALFSLSILSWPIMFFVTWRYAKDTQYYNEDGVIVPIHVRKEMGYLKSEDGKQAEVTTSNSRAGAHTESVENGDEMIGA
jgi:hypothetical protein